MEEHELDLLEKAYYAIQNVLLNYREERPDKYLKPRKPLDEDIVYTLIEDK